MIEREKIIKELESLRDICNAKSNMAIGKGKIAWAGYANTADDAIVLLKEQQQQIWELQDQVEYLTDKQKKKFFVYSDGKITPLPDIVRCKDCKFRQSRVSRIIDGKECNLCEMVKGYKPADWFCADGEHKRGGEVR